MPHVDDGTLHALLDGALRAEDPEGAATVERHLAGCEDCRARLDDAVAFREDARSILDAAAPAAAEAVPDFSEVRARANASAAGQSGTPGETSPRGTRRRMATQAAWTRRLAWAASLVVALGTGYLLHDLAEPPASTAEMRLSAPTADAVDGGSTPRGDAGAPPSAEPRPVTALDEPGQGERSTLVEDEVLAGRGSPAGSAGPVGTAGAAENAGTVGGAGAADNPAGLADAAGAGSRDPARAMAETPSPQSRPATDEGSVAATRRAVTLEEERAAEELVTAQREGQVSVAGADARALKTAPAAAPSRAPAMEAAEIQVTGLESYRWSAVALTAARRSLDGPVYLLPRATILELYVSAGTTAPRVMSRQRLASGILVEVVQWRGESETPPGAVAPSAAAVKPDAGNGPGLPTREVARVVRGPFLLQVTGSLPEELLAILAGSATAAP